jgi:hypothetical protein
MRLFIYLAISMLLANVSNAMSIDEFSQNESYKRQIPNVGDFGTTTATTIICTSKNGIASMIKLPLEKLDVKDNIIYFIPTDYFKKYDCIPIGDGVFVDIIGKDNGFGILTISNSDQPNKKWWTLLRMIIKNETN